MEPTLHAGDWLLVDPLAYRARRPDAGQLVVAVDPRRRDRWLIKRVLEARPDETIVLAGDNPAHAADGDAIGPVRHSDVMGQPWLRYWPLRRFGRVR